MKLWPIKRKLDETRHYFRNITDREVIGALNNLAGVLEDLIQQIEYNTDRAAEDKELSR